jgi:hypothetical protein
MLRGNRAYIDQPIFWIFCLGAKFRLCAASPRAHSANAPCLLWAFRCDPGRRRRDASYYDLFSHCHRSSFFKNYRPHRAPPLQAFLQKIALSIPPSTKYFPDCIAKGIKIFACIDLKKSVQYFTHKNYCKKFLLGHY